MALQMLVLISGCSADDSESEPIRTASEPVVVTYANTTSSSHYLRLQGEVLEESYGNGYYASSYRYGFQLVKEDPNVITVNHHSSFIQIQRENEATLLQYDYYRNGDEPFVYYRTVVEKVGAVVSRGEWVRYDFTPKNRYTGDVVLTSQSEVNAFGQYQYTGINGTLTLMGASITDVSALSTLEVITQELNIQNTSLTQLTGLEQVKEVSKLKLLDNSQLTGADLTQWARCTNLTIENNAALGVLKLPNALAHQENSLIGLTINLVDNPQLQQLDYAEGSLKVAKITLRNSPLLQQLPTFSFTNFVPVEVDNIGISNMEGFKRLAISESLVIKNNARLTSFAQLTQLVNVNKMIWIENNPILEEIVGIQPTTIDNVLFEMRIIANERLRDLTGFRFLNGGGAQFSQGEVKLQIRNNPQLSNFCFLNYINLYCQYSEYLIEGNQTNYTYEDRFSVCD